MNNKNVIIYCRVSTDKQAKTWDSLNSQEQECREYCKRNNYNVLAVFLEKFTGTKDKRPKIEEAKSFIENSELKIDYVIVLKIDRVSRWWVESYNKFKKQFLDLWVIVKDVHWMIWEEEVIFKVDWVDTSCYDWAKNNNKKMSENLMAIVSEWERNTILQRMTGQAIKYNSKWYKVRNSEFWFMIKKVQTSNDWKRSIQVEDPNEWRFIKRIFELKARWDLSDREITQEINIMWYKSREKNKWNSDKTVIIWKIWWIKLTSEQLKKYIENPIYAWIVKEQWIWNKAIKAQYDGLVSIELWNKANRWKYKIEINWENIDVINLKEDNKNWDEAILKKRKNYNPEYMLQKVLICPECWGNFTAEKCKSKNWTYHHYYSCRWKWWVKHKNFSLRRDKTNNEVIEFFKGIKFNKDIIDLFNDISIKVYNEKNIEELEKQKNIEKEINNLKIEKNNINSNIMKLIDFPELLKSQNLRIKEIEVEISKLEKNKILKNNIIWLERFKKYSKKILEHPEKLLLQKENPEIIQLCFDIFFWWKIEYKNLKSRTPIIQDFLALKSKKKSSKSWNSFKNSLWSEMRDSNSQPHGPKPCALPIAPISVYGGYR